VKEGEQGVYHINRRIENYLQQKRLIRITGEFYENRPVMVTGNNYELELFNGDVGIIRKNADGIAMAWFENGDGTLKPVLPAFISRLETVYAMTIHKSQGSEFNKVMVVLPDNEEIAILKREILYTALTSAKEKVIVLGKKEVILNAAKRQVKRTSGICERFAEK
jgi:exodeoxyribonuclease V alpha subunit